MAASNTQDFTDNAMLELFRAEVDTHTQTLNEGLLALEKEPGQLKWIEPLMRAAHSIKGAARIVAVEDGVRVAHAMEDCFVAAQNGQIALTSEAIDILLQGVDALIRIANPEQAVPDAASLDGLLQGIAAIRQGRSTLHSTATPPPDPAKPQAAERQAGRGEKVTQGPAIAVVVDGTARTVGVPAPLDTATAERLRLALLDQLDGGARQFRLDLGSLQDVEAEGLALLDLFAREARAQEKQTVLELINVRPDLAALFQATGLERLYALKKVGC